ncbi:MAG TPA: hypothetical protein VKP30_07085 [Polyangiaceae bacterium]|nr:hypothetical protein [Polyangiaceae bacterium]
MPASCDSRVLVSQIHSKGLVGSMRSPYRSCETTVSRRALASSLVGCTLLFVAGCGETSSGSGSTGRTQDSEPSTRATGGSSVREASSAQQNGGSGGSKQSSARSSRATSSNSQDSGGSSSSDDQSGGTVGQTDSSSSTATNGTSGGNTTKSASGGNTGKSGGNTGKPASGGTRSGTLPEDTSAAAGRTGVGGQSSVGGGAANPCVGKAWPTANPTAAGPFEVAADKNVGPLAGYTPDPIYGDKQQRFNIYRPKNLADSGYCHPILIWANGHTDNPEPNPPECVVDSNANKWCGQYLPLMNHLASQGFVVVASLSTTTSRGEPLPTIAGLNWILKQAQDSTSPYYHRLDTANIGQLGHSEGGMSTCMSAAEPRYKALATICGTRALSGVHTPMLFFCGGKDSVVNCSGVRDVFLTVKDQPAFFIDELGADHGSWVYGGAKSPSLSAAAAWFRVHLMGDTANRKYFYGPSCTFCTDNRVKAEQNSLMTE